VVVPGEKNNKMEKKDAVKKALRLQNKVSIREQEIGILIVCTTGQRTLEISL
jgi:hypothetical protein